MFRAGNCTGVPQERDESEVGEGRLEQKLASTEQIMERLARTPAEQNHRAEKITDHDKFDSTRDKLKSFKDRLLLKTSGNSTRCDTPTGIAQH